MILEQIEKDFIEAYKAKDELKVSTLRLLKSSLKNAEISKKATLSDEDAVAVLRREVKQRREAAAEYKKLEQEDTAKKENDEIGIIDAYLPAELSNDEIDKAIAETAESMGELTAADFGKLMGAVMAKLKGQADGSLVSERIKSYLSR